MVFRIGAALTLGFVVLRASNLYGDPSRWSFQSSPAFTLLSFLNCTKYPPSLLFLLMTLGPALLVTSWIDRVRFTADHPLIVFGRVPLFYFLVHFWAIHLIAAVMLWLRHGNPALFHNGPPAMGGKHLWRLRLPALGGLRVSGYRWSSCCIRSAAGSRGLKSGAGTCGGSATAERAQAAGRR